MIGNTIGKYRIVDKLGEGGMGSVWKAEDSSLQRLVAIKALSRQLSENEEARERFIREAQATSSLNHASITTVYELLEDEGEQYIVMEYVDGKTIRDVVETSRVSIRKAVEILIQAAEALEAAHNKGILHRDVKSANIMVSMEGNVKVMDFGLAHLEERSQLTRTGTTMGTLAYSSPEQLVGSPVDRRSEIFSLGVVFYELLTGQLPFKSPSEGELVFEIINTEQEQLTTCREDVPENVCSVVNKMLIKKPELRYQTCGELLTDLKAIRSELETTTVQISTASDMGRAKKKMLTLGIASAMIVVGAAIIILAGGSNSVPRIAVLWSQDLNPPANQTFGDLFIINLYDQLARQGAALGVIGLESTRTYKDSDLQPETIREELKADFILTPTILWNEPEQLPRIALIRLELVDDTGIAVWTERITIEMSENLDDLGPVSRTLVKEIVETTTLRDNLTIVEMPDSPAAHRYFLQGMKYRTASPSIANRQLAIEMFSRSVEEDPDFSRGWAHLSEAASQGFNRYNFIGSRETAKMALDRAQQLNAESIDTQLALAYYNYWCLRNYDGATEALAKVLEQEPNNSQAHAGIGYIARRQNNFKLALDHLIQAADLDPSLHTLLGEVGFTALIARDYNLAEEYYDRVRSLAPNSSVSYVMSALLRLLWHGDVDGSLEAILELFSVDGQQAVLGDYQPHKRVLLRVHADQFTELLREEESPALLCRADLASTLGDTAQAHAIYGLACSRYKESLESEEYQSTTPQWRFTVLYRLGLAYAGMGEGELAVEYGTQAVNMLSSRDDSMEGTYSEIALAEIYTLSDQPERAIDILEGLLSKPSFISSNLLRVDPRWDSLRDNPRFQALLRKYR